MKLSYRPEIDGLRGLAIFIIFLSHFPDSIVKSGGVNIFFAISGFLIAQIIEQKYKHNLIGFYKSRIKSLFPQLLIISVIIYLFFLFFGEFEYIKRFYSSCKYAIIGILNIYFIKQDVNYGQESFLNPFGPFWAFSVIIQFYLTYGLIYKYVLNKESISSTLSKVTLLTLLSFFIYFLIFAINPNSKFVNFYSLLTRYWQFLAGASLYYILLKYTISNKTKNILILVALMILLSWQYFEVFNTNFQIKTLLITLIGLFIIAGSGGSHFVNKALSAKLMIQFGKISYPYYLWHMALIYFAYLYLHEVTFIHKILITFIVVVLSLFTIKINTLLSKQKYIIDILLLAIVLISSIMQIFNKNIAHYTKTKNYQENLSLQFEKLYPNINNIQLDLKDLNGFKCHDVLKLDCNFNLSGKSKVILLGTSHMSTFTKTLSDKLINQGYNVHSITRGGCPYLPEFYRTDKESCSKESMNVMKDLLLNSKKATIVLIQRFPLYLSGNFYTNSSGFSESNDKLLLLNDENKSRFDGFREAIQSLIDYGHKLVLVYPIPEFADNVPNYYKKIFYKYNFKELKESKEYYNERTNESFKLLDSFKSKNIERIYPSDFLCDDNYCYSMINNKILYSDDDHLNQNGVNLIAPEIIKKVNKLSLQNNN